MLRFPPARLPSDPSRLIEPYAPTGPAPARRASPPASGLRADKAMFLAGLSALQGRLFLTGSGSFIRVLGCEAGESGWEPTWFEWEGRRRRLVTARDEAAKSRLLDLLADAWPYEGGKDDALRREALAHCARAQAYARMDDADIVALNFELLMASADTIFSTPRLNDGALGGLSAAFVYMGRLRYPVSTLLRAWRAGSLRVPCPHARGGGSGHAAYILRGGGGFSMGEAEAYCPACRGLVRVSVPFVAHWKALYDIAPPGTGGYRLDEIVAELGGTLPPVAL